MCVLQSTEKGAEDVENVSMVTPQLPPKTCTAPQEVKYSMAHLCSFGLDCIVMNIKVNLWNEAYDTTAFQLNLHKKVFKLISNQSS